MKRELRLTYEDIYGVPIREEHIHLGWLNWMNDKDTVKFLTNPLSKYSEVDLKEYLRTDKSLCFLACYLRSGIYFGNLRIYGLGNNSASFGRLIGEEVYRGVGYGTKMSALALHFCFAYLRFDKVVVGNRISNERSSRSKINLGFSIADEELLRDLGITRVPGEHYFSISAAEFKERVR